MSDSFKGGRRSKYNKKLFINKEVVVAGLDFDKNYNKLRFTKIM